MIRDAATIIVARENPLQIFMVRRHSKSKFMANAWVYPGGAIDSQDLDSAMWSRIDVRPDVLAKRMNTDGAKAVGLHIAAIRETFEEAGILLATDTNGDFVDTTDPRFGTYRSELRESNTTLAQIAEEEDLRFPLNRLFFFSHWITPTFETRRFDTRFFLTKAPDQQASHDDIETSDGRWISPEDALKLGSQGEWFLAPPTVRTLQQLLERGGLGGSCEICKSRRPPCILPHLHVNDGSLSLLLPGDPEFPNDPEYANAEPVDDDVTRMDLDPSLFKR